MVCEDARMPMKGVNFRMTFTMWKVLQDWLLCKPRHSVDAHTKMKEEKSFNKKKLTVSVARVDHPSSCLVQDIISLFFFFCTLPLVLFQCLSLYIFLMQSSAQCTHTQSLSEAWRIHILNLCAQWDNTMWHMNTVYYGNAGALGIVVDSVPAITTYIFSY